jgi:hypothetical protein
MCWRVDLFAPLMRLSITQNISWYCLDYQVRLQNPRLPLTRSDRHYLQQPQNKFTAQPWSKRLERHGTHEQSKLTCHQTIRWDETLAQPINYLSNTPGGAQDPASRPLNFYWKALPFWSPCGMCVSASIAVQSTEHPFLTQADSGYSICVIHLFLFICNF